ncbi:MAG: hypothetical protein UR93_C0002G0036 [Berkelbacteria bacterium GW2011_GWA2_35_9]|uniref:Glutamyl-tRNA amidotransferase n=1 Tax=Berkelbacteria bacterium GW2011_GWA2_35_9 TaxID=1618333 RepID=A0A0G0D4K5_9BACT|nr:MAG: hypothetical protein UR93_C0002G0036 [Berkelbacteria bacterium GW2011_GWA2_35_9]
MLEEKINTDLITALKAKDVLKTSVLRLIKASIENKKIINHGEIDDDQILLVIKTELKQANETLDSLEKNDRDTQEQSAKIAVIKSYLPKQMEKNELEEIIASAIKSTNAQGISDMGKVIGQVMLQVKGQADGSVVSKIVKEKLS